MRTLQPSELRHDGACWLIGPCGVACARMGVLFPFDEVLRRDRTCPRFVRVRRAWDDKLGQAPLVIDCADSLEEAVALTLMGDA